MERYLIIGTEIKLRGIDGHYVIKDIIGRGSSCVVYSADFYNIHGEKTEHLLKEFNPRCIDLKRNAGELTPIKDEDKELFESLCNRFKEGFELQSKLRSVPELKNYTANIQNVYYDYGTVYIDMTETNGKSYAAVEEKSIYDLAQRIKVLAQVIGNYHKHGYLHLDIKPSNIFARPEDETCQDVLLFDFDSLVPFSEENGKCVIDKNASVSYTTEYAPIELLTSSRRGRICKATDIYEIGEIFFEKLMGRHSTALEHNVWSDYEYDRSSPIFENINPKVMPLLDELFAHTLCNDVNMRYQTTDKLIECLDEIIVLSNPREPYLEKNNLPNVSGFFTGRDEEIEEIHKRLQENNVLFLSGIGGIGKSELAKHYAKEYKSEYDAIIFAPFVNDVQMMIVDDSYVQIHNFARGAEEKPNEYFERKMKELAKLCNERTLIIVDNFDTTKDENLDKLLFLNCKMLITTRMDFSEDYANCQYDIGTLANPFEVFNEHYKKPLSEDELVCVDEIIEVVCGHTMTVELLAKQMMAGRVKPDKMLEKLKNGGISESGKEKVSHANEKGEISRENTYNHIQALFDLSDLDEDEKYVLANLSLIPHTGISAELFCEWCEIENFDVINNLAMEGWIRWDKEKDYVSLHTICADIMIVLLKKNIALSDTFFMNIKKTADSVSVDLNKLPAVFTLIDSIANRTLNAKFESYKIAEFLHTDLWGQGSSYGNHQRLELYYQLAIDLIKRLEGPEAKGLIDAYGNIASLYGDMALFKKAEEYTLRALDICNLWFGDTKNEYFVQLYNNLAIFYDNMNNLNKSFEFYDLALSLHRKLNDNNHDNLTATLHHNLACVLRKRGCFTEAYQHFQTAEAIWKELYGDRSIQLAYVYGGLGELFKGVGDYKKAEYFIRCALSIKTETVGECNADTADSLYLLGCLYQMMDKNEESKRCLERSLHIRQKTLGPHHSKTLETKSRLSM